MHTKSSGHQTPSVDFSDDAIILFKRIFIIFFEKMVTNPFSRTSKGLIFCKSAIFNELTRILASKYLFIFQDSVARNTHAAKYLSERGFAPRIFYSYGQCRGNDAIIHVLRLIARIRLVILIGSVDSVVQFVIQQSIRLYFDT